MAVTALQLVAVTALQLVAELRECSVQGALDRAGRHAEGGSRPLRGHLLPVAQHDHSALLMGQRPDDIHEQRAVGVLFGGVLDARVGQDITTNLLLLARLDAHASHAKTLLTKQVDLPDLVREAVAGRDVPAHLSLVVTAPDEPAPVTGHPGLLGRVLANLLDNAERHAATTITVTLTRDHERRQVVLDVANDGPPVPPEHHETIFERFSRLDDARTRDAGGTGLGLAIARRISTLHHGTLTLAAVRDDPAGARFTVRLPLAHEDVLPLVTELLHAWDLPDDIPALLTHNAGHQPLEDVVPDLARALVTAGRDDHLQALLRHVARQASAWEVTGLADILRDEGMPTAADELLAARTARGVTGPCGRR